MGKKQNKKNEVLENYKNIREKLISEGYKEEFSYILVLKANIFAFLIAGPFALLIVFVYFIIWNGFYI